jgi:hypothetical protein
MYTFEQEIVLTFLGDFVTNAFLATLIPGHPAT